MIKAGEKLKDERLSKGLTLEDVSKKTKIKISYLELIEAGKYDKLPSVSYAHGFVRSYTGFLGLPEEEIMAVFRREFDEEKAYRVLPRGFDNNQDIPLSRFKLKQTFILIILIFVFFMGFILFSYRYAFLNPPLHINNYSVSSSEVTITGNTDSNSTVYINKEAVSVDQSGHFKKTISVFSGKTTIIIKAVNKFLRETTKDIQIDVKGGS